MTSNRTYSDDDLVYVNPKEKTVIGPVKWTKDGMPIPLENTEDIQVELSDDDEKERKKRKRKKRYYPWGTYRSMNRTYRLEKKEREIESNLNLDEAMKKSNEEPFWD